jgi:hypothetical protein
MKCEEYELLISDMVDGEQGTPRSADLFVHMADCAECQRFLRYLLKLRNIAANSSFEESPGAAHPVSASGRRDAPPVTVPAREMNISDRSSSRILRKQIRMSVSSAAVTLVMLIVWTVAISLTVMRGENSGLQRERDQFKLNSMPSALTPSSQEHISPDSH